MKSIFKYIILTCIGGCIYCLIELTTRGRTHWTMFIVGGLCFVFCGAINEYFDWDMLIWYQMLIATLGITAIEFVSGCIINLWFGLAVWDYSNLSLNILGQVSLLFSFFWYILSGVAIILDDWLRYFLFNEEKPHYKFNDK